GQTTFLTDAVGNSSGFLLDRRGQQVAETDANGKSEIVDYDDAGRVAKITDRLGRVREFTYLSNNLLQQEDWRNSAGGSIVWTRSFTYNENDQLLTATDNNGTYTLTYDNLNRVATQQDPWGITLTFSYDAADRVTQITDTKGGTRTYEYDNADRNTVRKFTDGTTNVRLDLVYNDRNEGTEIDRYTDLRGTTLRGKTLYVYDDAGRVTSITHKNGSNTMIDSYSYTFDAADRVTQETSTLGPTRNYTYDADSELTGDGTSTFSFD